MIIPNLSERLRAGATLRLGWCNMADPLAAEVMLREGFDAVLFDMQHGALDFAQTMAGVAAAAALQAPALARIPVGDFALAARLLDFGAAAIVAPMINSAEDARRFVSFTKYPPLGERSWGAARAMAYAGREGVNFLHGANSVQLAIAMIETRAALDALDSILATDGVDGVLVGPMDLSIALTQGATVDAQHPEVEKALDHIAARARAHGKFASAFCPNGARAKQLAARGYQLVSVGADLSLLRAGARAELQASR
ncbi:MAG: hydroxyacid aldolase [Hyphomicrobiales bacterium]|nr:hydroxyacid aldolase [Hyphomicrobiales bacterium]